MSGFISWLEELNKKDTKVRAVLRRSLSFEPGTFIPAFPYVEPFVKDEDNSWRRTVHYLVAGLWAAHWQEGQTKATMSIGKASSAYLSQIQNDSRSIESRFITLLDADTDQLPHRLRQMTALLKDQPIDFEGLLKGLLYWNNDQKQTQRRWARDFYRSLTDSSRRI